MGFLRAVTRVTRVTVVSALPPKTSDVFKRVIREGASLTSPVSPLHQSALTQEREDSSNQGAEVVASTRYCCRYLSRSVGLGALSSDETSGRHGSGAEWKGGSKGALGGLLRVAFVGSDDDGEAGKRPTRSRATSGRAIIMEGRLFKGPRQAGISGSTLASESDLFPGPYAEIRAGGAL